MSDPFKQLLDRIREKEHPDHGLITWDGQTRSFEISVQFTRNGTTEDEEIIRKRALWYLNNLTPQERAAANIEVIFRDGAPVRAVLRGKTSNLDPSRLRGLEQAMQL